MRRRRIAGHPVCNIWILNKIRDAPFNGFRGDSVDVRDPVLYLRSFSDERRLSGLFNKLPEENLTTIFQYLGPVVALSDPENLLPPIGASRLDSDDEQWHSTIVSLISKCCLLIVEVSYEASEGLWWEVGAAFKQVPFKPMLFVFPFAYGGISSRREGYMEVRKWFKRATNVEMPELPASASCIIYWSPERAQCFFSSQGSLVAILKSLSPDALARYDKNKGKMRLLFNPVVYALPIVLASWLYSLSVAHQREQQLRWEEDMLRGTCVRWRKDVDEGPSRYPHSLAILVTLVGFGTIICCAGVYWFSYTRGSPH